MVDQARFSPLPFLFFQGPFDFLGCSLPTCFFSPLRRNSNAYSLILILFSRLRVDFGPQPHREIFFSLSFSHLPALFTPLNLLPLSSARLEERFRPGHSGFSQEPHRRPLFFARASKSPFVPRWLLPTSERASLLFMRRLPKRAWFELS